MLWFDFTVADAAFDDTWFSSFIILHHWLYHRSAGDSLFSDLMWSFPVQKLEPSVWHLLELSRPFPGLVKSETVMTSAVVQRHLWDLWLHTVRRSCSLEIQASQSR